MIGVLATFRLTSLLVAEDGPWSIFNRLRERAAGTLLGQVLSCFWCCSVWIGLLVAVLMLVGNLWVIALPFALSGAAILLGRWVAVA